MPNAAAKMVHASWARIPHPTRLNSIVGLAFELLVNAAAAFDVGAIYAASVATHSAVEAAGFLYPTCVPSGSGFQIVPLKTRSGHEKKPKFEDVRRGFEEGNALPDELYAKLIRIRDNGNYIAHFSSGVEGRLMKPFIEDRTRMDRGEEPVEDALWMVPFPTEVFADLQDRTEIVIALAEKKAADGYHPVSQPSRLSLHEAQ